jgi:glycosyltransferase involved in cell wall biosynthesis
MRPTGSPSSAAADGWTQPRTASLLVISPCRDEAQFAARTLDSVLAQTVRPARWILVDDGSADETPAILEAYAEQHPFLQIVRRSDRGRRLVGPGVVDAFYAGLELADLEDYEFVCKLDLDLELPPRYFEILLDRLRADPRLGTCSGKPYYRSAHGSLVSEGCGDEMSVGMTKLYRVACFREIGGFVREVMWDGIDCHRCRQRGWRVRAWDEDELRFVHLRPMGSSDKGLLTGRWRHGYGQWFMGTGPLYMLASAVYRMARRPYVIGGIAMFLGYASSWLRGRPRYPDLEFRRFLRRYQRRSLLVGKKRATAEFER